jgi:glycosyltransferase involved in cell wall biosynthesis
MNIGIVIATRNRPKQISILLDSICNQKIKAREIVIVSSGEKIDQIIEKFASKINIVYSHINGFGQILQKQEAIKLIGQNIDWVLFLDDDLILEPDTLENLFRYISKKNTIGVVGIGIKLLQLKNNKELKIIKSLFLKTFFLEGPPGTITKSGHPVSYLNENRELETEWLIGSSMWKREILNRYRFDYSETKYSAYEDVIFSYSCSKFGKLIFLPEAKLNFQHDDITQINIDIFRAAAFWRLYFIERNSAEFSKIKFLWAHIGRSLYFLIDCPGNMKNRLSNFIEIIKIWIELVYQITYKRNSLWSLRKIDTNGK